MPKSTSSNIDSSEARAPLLSSETSTSSSVSIPTVSKESDILGEALTASTAQGLVLASKLIEKFGSSPTSIALTVIGTLALEVAVTIGFRETQQKFRYEGEGKQKSSLFAAIMQQANLVQETAVSLILVDAGLATSGFLATATLFRMAKRWLADSDRGLGCLTKPVLAILAPIFPTGEAAIMHVGVPMMGLHNLLKYGLSLYGKTWGFGLSAAALAIPGAISLSGLFAERPLQRHDIEGALISHDGGKLCTVSVKPNTSLCTDAGTKTTLKYGKAAYYAKLASNGVLFGTALSSLAMNLFQVTLGEVADTSVSRNVQTITMAASFCVGAVVGVFAGNGQFKSRVSRMTSGMAGVFGNVNPTEDRIQAAQTIPQA